MGRLRYAFINKAYTSLTHECCPIAGHYHGSTSVKTFRQLLAAAACAAREPAEGQLKQEHAKECQGFSLSARRLTPYVNYPASSLNTSAKVRVLQGQGLGQELALCFSGLGASLILSARNTPRLEVCMHSPFGGTCQDRGVSTCTLPH